MIIRLRPARGQLATLVVGAALAGCQPSAATVSARAAQAQQLLEAGRLDEAEAMISAAVRRRDDVPAALLVQGRVALARGNRGLAFQAFRNALSLDATNAEALSGVAQLGLSTGHLREAEDAADKILLLQPEETSALTIKALIAIVRNDLDAADGFADRILRARPRDLGGLILKSRVQGLRGNLDAALATLKPGEDAYASNPDFSMALAELYRAKGDGPGLLAQLERLRNVAPDRLNYRVDLVDTLYRLGKRDEARGEVAALIAMPAKDPETIDGLVRIWNATDREAMTPAMVDAASRTASLEARLAFARYFVATGRPSIAVALLRPLATGWSADVQGMMAYAGAVGGAAGATQASARLLDADPGNGGALLVRIRTAMAQRRPRDAVVDAQRVVADFPQWDEGYLALAAAYDALGDRVGVRRAFEQGVHARPQSLPLVAAYLDRLTATGDGERAIEVARRFALANPSLPAAWTQYAAVCARQQGDDCRAEAADGLAAARKRFGLDPAPGTPPPVGAIGRLR